MFKRSRLNNREMTILIIAALVKKLGGMVEIYQSDIDDVAFNTLMEDGGFEDGHMVFYLKERSKSS